MTKAQEVRTRRLKKMQSDITVQVQKVFDWMLDLIDADTKKGYLGSIEVCLFYDETKIRTSNLSGKEGTEYELKDFFLQHDRIEFFSALKKVVEQEEGFKASLNPDSTLWSSKCIIFQIVIE